MQPTWLRIDNDSWNVCDWKTTEGDQPSETHLSLPTCTHRKSRRPSFRLWPSRFRKEVHILHSIFKTIHTNKVAQKGLSFHSRLTCGDVCAGSWQNRFPKGSVSCFVMRRACMGRQLHRGYEGLDNLFARFIVLLGLLLFAFAFVLLLKGPGGSASWWRGAGKPAAGSPGWAVGAATSSADSASFLLQGQYPPQIFTKSHQFSIRRWSLLQGAHSDAPVACSSDMTFSLMSLFASLRNSNSCPKHRFRSGFITWILPISFSKRSLRCREEIVQEITESEPIKV